MVKILQSLPWQIRVTMIDPLKNNNCLPNCDDISWISKILNHEQAMVLRETKDITKIKICWFSVQRRGWWDTLRQLLISKKQVWLARNDIETGAGKHTTQQESSKKFSLNRELQFTFKCM